MRHQPPPEDNTLDPATLARVLPHLGAVSAVTCNGCARMSHTAPYDRFTVTDGPFRCADDHVSLRIHTPSIAALTAIAGSCAEGTPPVLRLTNAFGQSVHQAYLHTGPDESTLAAIKAMPDHFQRTYPEAPSWDRQTWEEADQVAHIDSISADCGFSRRRAMHQLGIGTPLDPKAAGGLLADLAAQMLPVTMAVPNAGCTQLLRAQINALEQRAGLIHVLAGTGMLTFDPMHIAECLVTTAHGVMGPTSMIELYDYSQRCVALFTQTGPTCPHLHAAWQELVAAAMV